jgi:serine/threonine protein phosphatase PrpC
MSLRYVAQCSAAQQQQRYEDVLLQAPAPGDCCSRSFGCWALFDGYNGHTVARFLASSLLPELESCLPAMHLPQEESEQYVYADAVRRAVTAAFLSLSLRVRELTGGAAAGCGSAAAVVVQTGHLLTVANAGSSKVVLDVGHTALECSADHRLGNNEDEEERLDAGGPASFSQPRVHSCLVHAAVCASCECSRVVTAAAVALHVQSQPA